MTFFEPPTYPFDLQKTDGGYVFKAPSIWLFGRSRSYLITNAQKELLVGPSGLDVVWASAAGFLAAALFVWWPELWLPDTLLTGSSKLRSLVALMQGAMPVFISLQSLQWLTVRRIRPVVMGSKLAVT